MKKVQQQRIETVRLVVTRHKMNVEIVYGYELKDEVKALFTEYTDFLVEGDEEFKKYSLFDICSKGNKDNLKGIEDDFPFPNTLWDFHIIDKRFFTVVRTEDEMNGASVMYCKDILKEIADKYRLPIKVKKTTWYGDYYFLLEEKKDH